MKAGLIMAVSGAVLAGCLAVGPVEQRAVVQAEPSPQEIVAARQAAFHMSGAALRNIKATIDNGGDPKSQAFAAAGLARWARALPTLFPQSNSTVTPSRARPEIWANKADFNAKAAAFAAAASQLAAAAESGDKAALASNWAATGATCLACHQAYQAPQRPGG